MEIRSSEYLPWIAGLFEGEGCFDTCTAGAGSNRYPRPRIRMVDEDVIVKAHQVLVGLIGTCPNPVELIPKGPNKQPQYEIYMHGELARKFMTLIARFMSAHRRHQICAALQGKKLSATNGSELLRSLEL